MSSSGQFCKCSICHKNYSKSYIELHMRTHTGVRPFECTNCGKSFTQSSILRNHILCLHTKNEYKWFQCNTCSKTFVSKKRLTTHVRIHTRAKKFRCDTCNKYFMRKGQLTAHSEWWHRNNRTMLICAHCKRRFSNKPSLQKHIIETHEGVIDTFMCDICGKKYVRKDCLSNHIQVVHFKSKHRTHKKFQSSNTTFARQTHAKGHNRTNNGENSHVCQICNSSFSLSTVLKTHIRVHTGEKLYVCKLCQNSFEQLTDLREHLSNVHEERYFCGACQCIKESQKELMKHKKECDTDRVKSTAASLSKMRFLFAILLTKILTPHLLEKLGFGKRLVDDILQDCISQTEQPSTNITNTNEAEKFRCKLQIFLEWGIPDEYMEHLRYMTTEDILKRLVQK